MVLLKLNRFSTTQTPGLDRNSFREIRLYWNSVGKVASTAEISMITGCLIRGGSYYPFGLTNFMRIRVIPVFNSIFRRCF